MATKKHSKLEKITSGYDCRNKCVFSFFLNTDSDEADVMSSGRLFQSFGPAEANERSPTVTRRDGRTSSWLEVADRRRRRDGKSATRRRRSDRYRRAVQCRAELGIQGSPVWNQCLSCMSMSVLSVPWAELPEIQILIDWLITQLSKVSWC